MPDLLTDLQQKALDAFFDVPSLRQTFYLTGGTALAAYYLGHRLSDDLDLFTHTGSLDEDARMAEDAMQDIGIALARTRSSPTFRRYVLADSLQMDLVRDIDFRVGTPELHGSIMVDNPKNIAVNKITALYGRLDPKDYVDFYFLMHAYNYDLLELLKLAQHKDAGLELFQWAKVITDADTLSVLPRMVKPLELRALKKFFRNVRDQVLDAIRP